MEPNNRILIAPLDWGLGHATRCIPIITELLNRKQEVIIASTGSSLALLQNEFPALKHFELPAYKPNYSLENESMTLKMLAQLPKFMKAISAERDRIEEIVQNEGIMLVISDNRYGCYSKKAKSIFITHQLNILMPDKWKWMEKRVNEFNHKQIRRFNECWIPAPNSSLIPKLLSSPKSIKKRYIGHLTRLNQEKADLKYDVVAIMSGPPPQRELLADKIRQQFNSSNLRTLLVEGVVNGKTEYKGDGNHWEKNFMLSQELNQAINQSAVVIARSGYSTVMDLAKLDKRAILVPTPGQTEQEYIAQQLKQMRVAFSTSQRDFDLVNALRESSKFEGFSKIKNDESLLSKAIDSLL